MQPSILSHYLPDGSQSDQDEQTGSYIHTGVFPETGCDFYFKETFAYLHDQGLIIPCLSSALHKEDYVKPHDIPQWIEREQRHLAEIEASLSQTALPPIKHIGMKADQDGLSYHVTLDDQTLKVRPGSNYEGDDQWEIIYPTDHFGQGGTIDGTIRCPDELPYPVRGYFGHYLEVDTAGLTWRTDCPRSELTQGMVCLLSQVSQATSKYGLLSEKEVNGVIQDAYQRYQGYLDLPAVPGLVHSDDYGVEALYTKEYHYAYTLNFKGKGRLTWQDQGPITYTFPIYHMRKSESGQPLKEHAPEIELVLSQYDLSFQQEKDTIYLSGLLPDTEKERRELGQSMIQWKEDIARELDSVLIGTKLELGDLNTMTDLNLLYQ